MFYLVVSFGTSKKSTWNSFSGLKTSFRYLPGISGGFIHYQPLSDVTNDYKANHHFHGQPP